MKLAEIIRRSTGDPEIHSLISFIKPPKRRFKIKRNLKGTEVGSETLWLDNPTSTPCSSCGY